jgi:hypothetical protein
MTSVIRALPTISWCVVLLSSCLRALTCQPTKKNAQAPLSSLYDHNSPLEQLHYTLLLHILRRQGFGFLLDSSHSTPHFRKLLAETVLATDMRVHTQFMQRFQQIVNGAEVDLWTKRVLVCQALIKAADISNPVIELLPSRTFASSERSSSVARSTFHNIGRPPYRKNGRHKLPLSDIFTWPHR